MAQDVFDRIELDIFDRIDAPKLKEYVAPPKVSVSLSDEIRDMIKSEIGRLIKDAVMDAVKDIKPRTVETKTVERVVEKSIPTPQKVIIKDKLDDQDLHKAIEKKIKKALDDHGPMFVPAPPVIPNWADKADGVVLSKKASQLVWVTPTAGGGGGTSSDVYTPSNVTTTQSFDANNTSLDEIADVIGSLIVSLQGAGIIQ
jgi:ribosome-associated translation inhibitor RaiA